MAASHLVAVAYQTVTTTQPPPIDEQAIGDAMTNGLAVFVVVALIGAIVLIVRGKSGEFLVDPPAVFSLKDGWLTNLTGLSAAAVAVASGTGVADALLDKGTQVGLALLGFIVVAILGLAPIVLGASTRFKKVKRDDKDTVVSFTPSWGYVLAASVTAGGAAAQLAGLRVAADALKLSPGARQTFALACQVLGVIAVAYVLTVVYKTITLSEPEPDAESQAAMPRSLTL